MVSFTAALADAVLAGAVSFGAADAGVLVLVLVLPLLVDGADSVTAALAETGVAGAVSFAAALADAGVDGVERSLNHSAAAASPFFSASAFPTLVEGGAFGCTFGL